MGSGGSSSQLGLSSWGSKGVCSVGNLQHEGGWERPCQPQTCPHGTSGHWLPADPCQAGDSQPRFRVGLRLGGLGVLGCLWWAQGFAHPSADPVCPDTGVLGDLLWCVPVAPPHPSLCLPVLSAPP